MSAAESEQRTRVTKVTADDTSTITDHVTVEEPMEIRVVFGDVKQRSMRSLSITMRTPGDDRELAAGFLFTESVISSPEEIDSFSFGGVTATGEQTGNIVRVDLKAHVQLDMSRLQRHFFTTSSCGVCGKASLEALAAQGLSVLQGNEPKVASDIIRTLPDKLRASQPAFANTGGIHAAGLFDVSGSLLAVKEDVGRHNAVDKLVGKMFLEDRIPLTSSMLVISGRASFEIMQKALIAGVPVVIAVGAPSSLAISLAEQYNVTLIGFASAKRFNLYTGAQRVAAV